MGKKNVKRTLSRIIILFSLLLLMVLIYAIVKGEEFKIELLVIALASLCSGLVLFSTSKKDD